MLQTNGTEYFNKTERGRILGLMLKAARSASPALKPGDLRRLHSAIKQGVAEGCLPRNRYGINPLIHNLEAVTHICNELEPSRSIVAAILLQDIRRNEKIDDATVEKDWDTDTLKLIKGLLKVSTLYSRQAAVMSDNFRNLLLTFAEDIRVIMIMIADRVVLMRAINHHPDENYVRDVAYEASYLYAPLAHRLGLYHMKSELEDLALKYTNRKIYTEIAHQLNETKVRRDAYIANFIGPVREKLEQAGLKFEIKGRTKSISSIWNKIKKQNNDLEHIYDLFAIRVIIDAPSEREKSSCWLAYSIVTDMYTPNPARMKDWISIPKSNGYESLHTTVRGPEGRWVEVQIRTRRMDLIAEKGLAAHWKYKGIKSEGGLDAWMNNVRDILETAESGPMELMKNLKMDIYSHEVFAFTPRGDLFRLPEGATVLDFAFAIHSGLGCTCTGAIVNGRHRKLNYKLQSGDTVEITTASSQAPRQDWLNIAVTSKARNKIRQTLNERARRAGELAREMLLRRFKNRKIDVDEGILSKVTKKMGYKTATEFFAAIADNRLEPGQVIAEYESMTQRQENAVVAPVRGADEFVLQQPAGTDREKATGADDVLIIGDNIKGLNYKLSKCCNPIYGDKVFGFVSAEGVIKIHRDDCPNANNIKAKYPYRIINTRWSGTLGGQFATTLGIVGRDDLGIVTNITSIIAKEKRAYLRNISIDSHDGMFRGYLVVGVETVETLDSLIKKIKTVKGVKDVQRSN